MKKWTQENIKGQKLELSITREKSNEGLSEEYSAFNPSASPSLGQCTTLLSTIFFVFVILTAMEVDTIVHTIFMGCIGTYFTIKILFQVAKETVLYVPSVGIQQTTFYACGLQSPRLIPTSNIDDIIINEDIGLNHSFYLAVVLKSDDEKHKLYPLFQKLKPRLDFLKEVHNKMLSIRGS